MNKLERRLKERDKWIRRIKAFGYWNYGKPESFTYCWKAQAKPCSCPICSDEKYRKKDRQKEKLNTRKLYKEHLELIHPENIVKDYESISKFNN